MISLIFLFVFAAKINQRLFETASSTDVDISTKSTLHRYNLTFNYETLNRSNDVRFSRYRNLNYYDYRTIVPRTSTKILYEQAELKSTVKDSHALCFPSKSRPNGCQPLLLSQTIFDNISFSKKSHSKEEQVKLLPPLPCVSGLPCPYKKFRCTKGHEWKVSINYMHSMFII